MIRISFLTLIFCVNLFSQVISRKEARRDLEYFLQEAEKIHPNLYANVSRKKIKEKTEQLLHSLDDSISIREFSKKLFVWSASFKDGHTRIYPEKTLWENLKTGKFRFPFEMEIREKNFFILRSSDSLLKKGDKILSINGVKANELLNLSEYISREIEETTDEELARRLNFYFFLEYGLSDSLQLEIERKSEKQIIKIPLIYPGRKEKNAPYSFQYLNDSVGVLTVQTFAMRKPQQKQFGSFLDSVFQSLQNTKYLFVDLRKNGGGSESIGMQIFSYLGIPQYKPRKLYKMKISKAEKRLVRKYFLRWYMYPFYPLLLSSRTLRIMLHGKNGKIYDLPVKATKIKINKNAYKGKVFVLTSRRTYSAAADFVAAFAYARRGKIIGEPTGQPRRGFIDIIFITLPNSHLQAGVSFKIYEYEGTGDPHKGISPDIFLSDKKYDDEEFYKKTLQKIH